MISSALVDAAKTEKKQNWYGATLSERAEQAVLNTYGNSSKELLSHNKSYVELGIVPWKEESVSTAQKNRQYYYVLPFRNSETNLKHQYIYPDWFEKDSEKIKNSEKLYFGLRE